MSQLPKRPHAGWWMLAAGVGALGIAAVSLALMGAGNKGTLTGLQLTARWSYCFFLPAYAGGSLVTLFGPAFQRLARQGRSLGLAFASAHVTHLGLVVWLYHISAQPPVPTSSALYFGIAALLTYLLALFSFPRWVAMLPPRVWWALRTFGMEYIALAFLRDFLRDPFTRSLAHLIAYLPFIAFGVAALTLRLAAYAIRLRRRRLMSHAAA